MTWGQMYVRYAPCIGDLCFVSEAEKLKDCDDVTYGSGSAQAEKTKDAGAGYVCVPSGDCHFRSPIPGIAKFSKKEHKED